MSKIQSWVQLYQAFNAYQVAQYGIGNYLLGSATFWLSIVLVYLITLSLRVAERAIHSIWFPTDLEILAEHEHLQRRKAHALLATQTRGLVEVQSQAFGAPAQPVSGKTERPARIEMRAHHSSDENWLNI